MAQSTAKTTSASNKPLKAFRLKGVSCSVFANQSQSDGREIVFHKVSLQRVYKDGEEFKTTNSLGRDDLPVARLLLARAWEFILETESTRNREEVSE